MKNIDGYKKRFLTDSARKQLKAEGISALGMSDFERLDQDLKLRASVAGGDGFRLKRDCEKVRKRARELLAEAAKGLTPARPRRKSLKKATIEELLDGAGPIKTTRRPVFRDVEVEEDTSEVLDLLDIMAATDLGDEPVTRDLAELVDREQSDIEAALAGLTPVGRG